MGDDFRIYFVRPDKDEENNSTMVEAFEALGNAGYNFKPEWITSEECLNSASKNKQIYIFDPFEGNAFCQLKELNCRIYGPRCILANLLHGMDLPKMKRPIYNLAMKGVKICCTSIDRSSRDDVMRKVHLMGGEVDCHLTADVTHLIAGEVGSNKYLVAVEKDIPVMVKEWVYKVWEASQDKQTRATDELFDKFKCPPFLGLTVVVSGFSTSERNQMRAFIIQGGGKYSGELKMNECTHLIVKEPKGAKYEAAKNWQIKIVQERWLLDCMDKGRYLDPKLYQFDGNQPSKYVKTSTPERKSMGAPNISDISAISGVGINGSMQRVDETADMTARLSECFSRAGKHNDVAETKMGSTAFEDDTTIIPADIFLDGCRVYLSGIKAALEEKLRKIITTGGGIRCTEINQNVTHIVMGEVVASDILIVNKLTECPYVVTSEWLMDCFHQNTHLSAGKYLRTDLGLKLPVKADRLKNSSEIRKNASQASHTGKSDCSKDQPQESDAFRVDAPSDLEMAELLSQYIEPQGEAQPPNEEPTGDVQNLAAANGNSQNSTRKQEENEENLTQDPNDIPEDNAGKGIFHKRTFIILGFDEEETVQLTEFVTEKGGHVFSSAKTHQVADIAVVPLMGFPVDVTVTEILTNAWLQMCMEADTFLAYDKHWLFRPIELPESEPLTGCCVSVSGYVGVERECIMHLAQSLGANCQDHFARRSSKNVLACTHLIVNVSSGPKYDAAKKWKIPAVGKEWIFACIQKGKRASEEQYLIEILEAKHLEEEQMVQPASTTAEHPSFSPPTPNKQQTDAGTPHNDSVFNKEVTPGSVSSKGLVKNISACSSKDASDTKDSDHANDRNGGPLPEKRILKEAEDRIPTSSAESSDPNSVKTVTDPMLNPMAPIQGHLAAVTPATSNDQRHVTSAKKSACKPNQSENITAGNVKTPVDVRRQHWGQSAFTESPLQNCTPVGLIKGGGETPRTFMQPGFRAKFNLDGVFNTPDLNADLNKSTPLGETFKRQISKAAQNAAAVNATSCVSVDDQMPASQSQPDSAAPLHGVVIAVAKKLGRSHEQYNSIVVELGGNYSWHNGQHVTHFVFQGRPNDMNKEFRKAREEGKIIVSPYWLYACQEQKCRVDESMYPHNYNPNLALTMTPAGKSTPSRSTRAVTRNKGQTESSCTPGPSKTPAKKMPVLNLQTHPIREVEATTPKSTVTIHNSKTISPEVVNEQPANLTIETPTVQDPLMQQGSSTDRDVSKEDSTSKRKSQEIKEALSKTLGNVLAEASRSRRSNRKKSKRRNLSGQLNASDGNTSQDSLPRTGASGWSSKEPKPVPVAPEPSQSLQVTWEDPTEKLEKEKLAHRLERVCEPSQNTDDLLAAIEIPEDASNSRVKTRSASYFSDRSPTPEPPPLAFPLAKPTSHVMSPQPVELLSEESSESRSDNSFKQVPVFLISGMQNEERVDYSALVEQLGGKMIEKQHFDPSSTHLVVGQPIRNEKYLSCVASGKWVLHKSYFEACRKEGKFVKEEAHEWGSDFTLSLMQNMTSQACKLASAAHKWRKKVSALRKVNRSCKGAFDGWRVVLCLDRSKEENFQRLLEAGGAVVSTIRSPFPDSVKATHAFIDLNKIKVTQEDLEKLIGADIHCLKTEFIPAFLTDEPPPDPSEFYPGEITALKACMPEPRESRKRRRTENEADSSSSKTSRR